jgi:hypothetical protein
MITTTLPLSTNVSVDLTVELLQETMLALVDREYELRREANGNADPAIREIARRQLARVVGAICGIEDAIEGAALKAAA